jgi:hypothetical protein
MNARLIIGIGLFCAGGCVALAQNESEAETTFQRKIETRTFAGHPAMPVGVAAQAGTFHWIGAGAGFEGRVVKNAPYSAEGITETTRSLADGTKISQQTKSKVYRDSDGRTRREQTLAAIGEWSAAGEAPNTVTISNPVAGETYILDAKEKVARKIKVSIQEKIQTAGGTVKHDPPDVIVAAPMAATSVALPLHRRMIHQENAGPGPHMLFLGGREGDSKEEALGDRNIEGVIAKGTRVTTTLAVGKIGNDRPITIVHESWFSPELQAVVLSETKDPLSGDITYRLTNIQRANPPASLFEVPSDYNVQEGGTFNRRISVQEK